jgi:4-amino-4-deoxy-L-arabinose transferase-like glycosyltransferase
VGLGIYLFLLLIVFTGMFIGLGAGAVQQTDEATHGVNAYEMLVHGNVLVNTYKYAVDYFNSKPPLSLWCIMLSYSVFGYTAFALRFASAVAGCILTVMMSVFLWKKENMATAVFFTAAVPLMTSLFEFHMFRAGDMDSIYVLLFAAAMLALYQAGCGNGWSLVLYGLALGLAFLTKSIHAGMILLIGILYIPYLRKHISAGKIISAAMAAILVPGIWAVFRYRYDGMKFLYQMACGEAGDKIKSGPTLCYLQDILHSKIWLAMLAVLLADFVLLLLNGAKGQKLQHILIQRLKENYLFLLWLILPVLLYSMTGSHMPWYIYTSYIAAAVILAMAAGDIVRILQSRAKTSNEKQQKMIRVLITAFIFGYSAVCLTVAVRQIRRLNISGTGGNPGLQCESALQEFRDQYGDQYAGTKVYIENNDNVYSAQGNWENDYVFYAETTNDFICCDGGVAAFLKNQDGLLLLDKDLWDTYSDQLTGHVILEDDSYLIFSTQMY